MEVPTAWFFCLFAEHPNYPGFPPLPLQSSLRIIWDAVSQAEVFNFVHQIKNITLWNQHVICQWYLNKNMFKLKNRLMFIKTLKHAPLFSYFLRLWTKAFAFNFRRHCTIWYIIDTQKLFFKWKWGEKEKKITGLVVRHGVTSLDWVSSTVKRDRFRWNSLLLPALKYFWILRKY